MYVEIIFLIMMDLSSKGRRVWVAENKQSLGKNKVFFFFLDSITTFLILILYPDKHQISEMQSATTQTKYTAVTYRMYIDYINSPD